jgi:hypothetical protein
MIYVAVLWVLSWFALLGFGIYVTRAKWRKK